MRELMDFTESYPAPEATADGAVGAVSDDRPPAGTPCAWCKQFGHWCQAKIYFRDQELGVDAEICIPCFEGRDCDVVIAKLQSIEDSLQRFANPCQPVRSVIPVDRAKRIVVDEPVKLLRNGNGTGRAIGRVLLATLGGPRSEKREAEAAIRRERYAQPERTAPVEELEELLAVGPVRVVKEKRMPGPISEEVILQIQSAPENESTNALAKRLAVAYNTAYKYRKQTAKARRKPGSALAKQGPQTTGVPIDIVAVGERIQALATPLPQTIEGHVSLSIPQERLDAWWGRLAPEKKLQLALAEVGL